MALERRRGFKPDHKSFGTFILTEQARGPAVEASHDMVRTMKANAPRSAEGDGSHYADAFEVVPAGSYTAQNGNRRAIALVTNADDAAAANEFGDGPGAGREGPRGQGRRFMRRTAAPWNTGRAE